jgi:hypothetical protein
MFRVNVTFSVTIVRKFLELLYTGSAQLSCLAEMETLKQFGCRQLGFNIAFDRFDFKPVTDVPNPEHEVQCNAEIRGGRERKRIAQVPMAGWREGEGKKRVRIASCESRTGSESTVTIVEEDGKLSGSPETTGINFIKLYFGRKVFGKIYIF